MTDTRPRAEQKAREKHTGSARQQAKEALREEISTFNGAGVKKIASAAESRAGDDNRRLRVVAYCRVSTDDLDQTISIELQKDEYKRKIKANPQWIYGGTYADDGFSGTNTEHRPAFRLMMEDALAGRFDMIITKSVSRFARNLVDCIQWVRKLQDLNPPIKVFFEQENIDTLQSTSNIILFVLAMVAEEESHMKSEAMLLSLEWRFSRGRFLTPALLGYDKVIEDRPDGYRVRKLVINEAEADTVRLMYYMLLNGSSTSEIAQTLIDLQRPTRHFQKDEEVTWNWTPGRVVSVLRNERYCGDVLARKTWTPNFHDHKSKRNVNEKNKYFQPDHHEAIVTRAVWNAAQRILNSNRYRGAGSYLPMRVVDRGALCGYISVNRSWAGHDIDEYYRVCSIAMGTMDGELELDLASEYLPDGGHRMAGLTDEDGIQRIARALSEQEKLKKAELEGTPLEELHEKAQKVQQGYQVVNASMFTHVNDPVVRFGKRSITFNSTCVGKFNSVLRRPDGFDLIRCEYVEMLFNPVERMIAVRPCRGDHLNAMRWCTPDGRGRMLGATAFCRLLFDAMGWDDNYTYAVLASLQERGGERVLFFDLDNYIGKRSGPDTEVGTADTAEEARKDVRRMTEARENNKAIFYPADDEEPRIIEDSEDRLREAMEEIEKKTFGTPVFEHEANVRTAGGDDWDIMAEARVLGGDHRVDATVVNALEEKLMEELFMAAEDPPEQPQHRI